MMVSDATTNNIQRFFDKKIDEIQRTTVGYFSSANGAVASKKSGLCKLNVRFVDGSVKELALKTKSQRTLVNGIMLLSKKSPRLRFNLIMNHKIFSYNDSHRREISVYRNMDEDLKKNVIKYRGHYLSALKTYNIIFDYHAPNKTKLTLKVAKQMIDAILAFHIRYYNDIEAARRLGLNIYSPQDYRRAKNCIYGLYDSRKEEGIKLYGEKKNDEINNYISNIDRIMEKYAHHRSFTHNDFSTRNTFYDENGVRLYDFELSCFQNPEHDLVEFLMYDIQSLTDSEVKELIRYYRQGLRRGGIEIDDKEFRELLICNAYEFVVNRLSMTRTINANVELDFAKVSVPNSVRVLKLLETI